jgi:hypothetical protein
VRGKDHQELGRPGSVNGAGQVTFSGSLADGGVLSQSVSVSRDGRWPLYASLYTGKGSVWGWLAFDANQPTAGVGGLARKARAAISAWKSNSQAATRGLKPESGHRTYDGNEPQPSTIG